MVLLMEVEIYSHFKDKLVKGKDLKNRFRMEKQSGGPVW